MTDFKVIDRMGVIDIGSNSVRLVVFEGANRSPSYFYNEKVLCGLGIGLASSGVLNPDGKERAKQALRRFSLIAKRMKLTSLRAIATEAVRAAKDGSIFCKDVKAETGLEIDIITGEEEASLSAQGVLLSDPNASGLICDIGGASMELGILDHGRVGLVQTSRLGPMSINALSENSKEEARLIKEGIKKFSDKFADHTELLYLIGGSWRAIALLDMVLQDYPLHVLHEYEPQMESLRHTLDLVAKGELAELGSEIGVSSRRIDLIPVAARVLIALLDHFPINRIRFSSFGLREGVLYNALSSEKRARDPLLSAARAEESAMARFPGFGDKLFKWLKPLFRAEDKAHLRLIHAACLLHDNHWRSHPDYRADVCFDAATHTNLSGLDHPGRVFLAFCLMHRYKPRGMSEAYLALEELISEHDRALAKVAGIAIRLGAMMSSADPKHMGELKVTEDQLLLRLSIESQDIFGEVVLKRFNQLGSAMGKEAQLQYL